MAIRTYTIGAPTIIDGGTWKNIRWPSSSTAIRIDNFFFANGGPGWLRHVFIAGRDTLAQVMRFSDTATGDETEAGPDLTDALELYGAAFRFEAGAYSLTIQGPYNSAGPLDDRTEPYVWGVTDSKHGVIQRFIDNLGRLSQAQLDAMTITFNDGVPVTEPALFSGIATAGVPTATAAFPPLPSITIADFDSTGIETEVLAVVQVGQWRQYIYGLNSNRSLNTGRLVEGELQLDTGSNPPLINAIHKSSNTNIRLNHNTANALFSSWRNSLTSAQRDGLKVYLQIPGLARLESSALASVGGGYISFTIPFTNTTYSGLSIGDNFLFAIGYPADIAPALFTGSALAGSPTATANAAPPPDPALFAGSVLAGSPTAAANVEPPPEPALFSGEVRAGSPTATANAVPPPSAALFSGIARAGSPTVAANVAPPPAPALFSGEARSGSPTARAGVYFTVLVLADLDLSGYTVSFAGLLEVRKSLSGGTTTLWADISRGGNGRILDGDLRIDDVTDITKLFYSTSEIGINDDNSPEATILSFFFESSGGGADLTLFIKTKDGEVSWPAHGTHAQGGNYARWSLPPGLLTILEDLSTLDRVIFAGARKIITSIIGSALAGSPTATGNVAPPPSPALFSGSALAGSPSASANAAPPPSAALFSGIVRAGSPAASANVAPPPGVVIFSGSVSAGIPTAVANVSAPPSPALFAGFVRTGSPTATANVSPPPGAALFSGLARAGSPTASGNAAPPPRVALFSGSARSGSPTAAFNLRKQIGLKFEARAGYPVSRLNLKPSPHYGDSLPDVTLLDMFQGLTPYTNEETINPGGEAVAICYDLDHRLHVLLTDDTVNVFYLTALERSWSVTEGDPYEMCLDHLTGEILMLCNDRTIQRYNKLGTHLGEIAMDPGTVITNKGAFKHGDILYGNFGGTAAFELQVPASDTAIDKQFIRNDQDVPSDSLLTEWPVGSAARPLVGNYCVVMDDDGMLTVLKLDRDPEYVSELRNTEASWAHYDITTTDTIFGRRFTIARDLDKDPDSPQHLRAFTDQVISEEERSDLDGLIVQIGDRKELMRVVRASRAEIRLERNVFGTYDLPQYGWGDGDTLKMVLKVEAVSDNFSYGPYTEWW